MNDSILVRAATAADTTAIADLTREAYAKWVPLIGREPLPMTVNYVEAAERDRFDLLYAGDDLAALIETTPQDDLLLVVNVAVRPAFQGRGFGVRLLKLAEEQAVAAGLAGMRLYTNKQFTQNIRLYTSLGYVVEREETSVRGVTVHMVKAFAAKER